MSIRCRNLFLTLAMALVLSCGSTRNSSRDPRGALRLKGEPGDAILEVDETRLGPIRLFEKSGVLLRPGEHRIVVRADGYFPEYRLISVEKDAVVLVEVMLRKEPE